MNTTERVNVLTTVHGSRLYGLHHAKSDYDTYNVYVDPSRNAYRAKHKVKGLEDDFNSPLSKFMVMCNSGVPQALEALFSPHKVVAEGYEPFFNSYRVDVNEARMRYRRTVKSFGFVMQDGEVVDAHPEFKKRRHALRLTLNLNSLMTVGRFNSTLTDQQITFVNDGANLSNGDYVKFTLECLELAQLGELTHS